MHIHRPARIHCVSSCVVGRILTGGNQAASAAWDGWIAPKPNDGITNNIYLINCPAKYGKVSFPICRFCPSTSVCVCVCAFASLLMPCHFALLTRCVASSLARAAALHSSQKCIFWWLRRLIGRSDAKSHRSLISKRNDAEIQKYFSHRIVACLELV